MNNQASEHSKVTIKGLLQGLFSLLVFVLIFVCVSEVCREKTGDDAILKPTQVSKQRIDVIFAGSSHMNNAVQPMKLWNDYGITGYNHAQSGQIIPVSYYSCKEVIELYQPKVLVLDMYMLYHSRNYGNITWMHQSLDLLRPVNRIQATLELVPQENWEEFLIPFSLYHSRWNALTSRDFGRQSSIRELTISRGCATNFNTATDILGMSLEYTPADVKKRPADVPVAYLERIVEMCKNTNTQLLLVTLPYFISSEYEEPTHDMSNDQAYFNWVADFAKEHGVDYINYFHLMDEIGFVWAEHLYNYSHMNYWGGDIITEHIGKYIHTNYELEDRRQDVFYKNWNDDYKTYMNSIEDDISQTLQ